tara:strand:+ start:2764 stop:3432 length:669 start_codon:yes stop_codon:yes gene_type:complete
MTNLNNQTTNSNEETVMTSIQSIFQEFISNGGEPKVTAFKKHLDQLINSDIKPLCSRSGKTADGNGWRSELKAKFGGRGAKWVFVSLENIRPTLDKLSAEGVDIQAYDNFTQAHGQAWIRFSGGRIDNGKQCAAFEVRTEGSTIDHPKQLHYVPVSELDDTITFMNSTPHSMKVEETKKEEAEERVMTEEDERDMRTELAQEAYEDAMGDIEALMEMENMDF